MTATDAGHGTLHARDVEVEQTFIAGVLRNPHIVTDCEEILSGPPPFVDLLSQQAWDAICDLSHTGASVTENAVRIGMLTQGATKQQAQTYIVERQADGTLMEGDTRRAAERVRDARVVRAVSASAATIQSVCHDPASTGVDALGALTHALNEVSAASVTTSDMMERGDALLSSTFDGILARAGSGLPGISTGSTVLDDMTGGLVGGQLIVVGARPAVGKSVTVIDWARAALRDGAGVIVFSQEMPRHEIMERFIAAEGSIDASAIRTGDLTAQDERRFAQAASSLPWHNLVVVDKPRLTIGQATAIARQVHRQFAQEGIEKVVCFEDYLQIMGSDQGGRRDQSRQQFLGEVCVGFKGIAVELDMPVVVLSQLGRGAGKDRPPTEEDLRESGDIENNADVVILLHRPDKADPEDRPGEIDYLMPKHRQAPAPQIRTRTHLYRHFRTHDMAYESEPPEM